MSKLLRATAAGLLIAALFMPWFTIYQESEASSDGTSQITSTRTKYGPDRITEMTSMEMSKNNDKSAAYTGESQSIRHTSAFSIEWSAATVLFASIRTLLLIALCVLVLDVLITGISEDASTRMGPVLGIMATVAAGLAFGMFMMGMVNAVESDGDSLIYESDDGDANDVGRRELIEVKWIIGMGSLQDDDSAVIGTETVATKVKSSWRPTSGALAGLLGFIVCAASSSDIKSIQNMMGSWKEKKQQKKAASAAQQLGIPQPEAALGAPAVLPAAAPMAPPAVPAAAMPTHAAPPAAPAMPVQDLDSIPIPPPPGPA